MDTQIVSFSVVKEKIIKTDEVLQMYKNCNVKLKKSQQLCKEYKSKLEHALLSQNTMQAEHVRIRDSLKDLENQNREIQQQNENLSQQLVSLEGSYSKLLNDSQTDFLELKKEICLKEKLNNKCNKDISSKEHEDLKSQIQQLSLTNKELNTKFLLSESQCNMAKKFENDIVSLSEEIENLKKQLKMSETRASEISNREQLKDKEYEKLSDDLKTVKKELEYSKTENAKLKEQIQKQDNTKSRLHSKLTSVYTQSHENLSWTMVEQINLESCVLSQNKRNMQKLSLIEPKNESVGKILSEMTFMPEMLLPIRSPPRTCKPNSPIPSIVVTPSTPSAENIEMNDNVIFSGPASYPESRRKIIQQSKHYKFEDTTNKQYSKFVQHPILKRKLRRKVTRKEDSLLHALQVLKKSNINFSIYNELALPVDIHIPNYLQCPNSVDQSTRTQQAGIKFEPCMYNDNRRPPHYMMFNNQSELLGFFKVKSEDVKESDMLNNTNLDIIADKVFEKMQQRKLFTRKTWRRKRLNDSPHSDTETDIEASFRPPSVNVLEQNKLLMNRSECANRESGDRNGQVGNHPFIDPSDDNTKDSGVSNSVTEKQSEASSIVNTPNDKAIQKILAQYSIHPILSPVKSLDTEISNDFLMEKNIYRKRQDKIDLSFGNIGISPILNSSQLDISDIVDWFKEIQSDDESLQLKHFTKSTVPEGSTVPRKLFCDNLGSKFKYNENKTFPLICASNQLTGTIHSNLDTEPNKSEPQDKSHSFKLLFSPTEAIDRKKDHTEVITVEDGKTKEDVHLISTSVIYPDTVESGKYSDGTILNDLKHSKLQDVSSVSPANKPNPLDNENIQTSIPLDKISAHSECKDELGKIGSPSMSTSIACHSSDEKIIDTIDEHENSTKENSSQLVSDTIIIPHCQESILQFPNPQSDDLVAESLTSESTDHILQTSKYNNELCKIDSSSMWTKKNCQPTQEKLSDDTGEYENSTETHNVLKGQLSIPRLSDHQSDDLVTEGLISKPVEEVSEISKFKNELYKNSSTSLSINIECQSPEAKSNGDARDKDVNISKRTKNLTESKLLASPTMSSSPYPEHAQCSTNQQSNDPMIIIKPIEEISEIAKSKTELYKDGSSSISINSNCHSTDEKSTGDAIDEDVNTSKQTKNLVAVASPTIISSPYQECTPCSSNQQSNDPLIERFITRSVEKISEATEFENRLHKEPEPKACDNTNENSDDIATKDGTILAKESPESPVSSNCDIEQGIPNHQKSVEIDKLGFLESPLSPESEMLYEKGADDKALCRSHKPEDTKTSHNSSKSLTEDIVNCIIQFDQPQSPDNEKDAAQGQENLKQSMNSQENHLTIIATDSSASPELQTHAPLENWSIPSIEEKNRLFFTESPESPEPSGNNYNGSSDERTTKCETIYVRNIPKSLDQTLKNPRMQSPCLSPKYRCKEATEFELEPETCDNIDKHANDIRTKVSTILVKETLESSLSSKRDIEQESPDHDKSLDIGKLGFLESPFSPEPDMLYEKGSDDKALFSLHKPEGNKISHNSSKSLTEDIVNCIIQTDRPQSPDNENDAAQGQENLKQSMNSQENQLTRIATDSSASPELQTQNAYKNPSIFGTEEKNKSFFTESPPGPSGNKYNDSSLCSNERTTKWKTSYVGNIVNSLDLTLQPTGSQSLTSMSPKFRRKENIDESNQPKLTSRWSKRLSYKGEPVPDTRVPRHSEDACMLKVLEPLKRKRGRPRKITSQTNSLFKEKNCDITNKDNTSEKLDNSKRRPPKRRMAMSKLKSKILRQIRVKKQIFSTESSIALTGNANVVTPAVIADTSLSPNKRKAVDPPKIEGNKKIKIVQNILIKASRADLLDEKPDISDQSLNIVPYIEESTCSETCATAGSSDILSQILSDMNKDKSPSFQKTSDNKICRNGIGDKDWRKNILDIAEITCQVDNVDLDRQRFEDIISNTPLASVKKKLLAKRQLLVDRLLLYSIDSNIPEDVVLEFKRLDVYIVTQIILQALIKLKEAVSTEYYPAPLMTKSERIFLALMVRLQNEKMSNIFEVFLNKAQKLIFRIGCSREQMISVTRFYVAICRLLSDVRRMRLFYCEAFYRLANNAVTLLFTILKSWPEIFPHLQDVQNFPLAKVIVQIINGMENRPLNLGVLRNLLNQFYGYPVDKWDCDKLFDELSEQFLCSPTQSSGFAIKLQCKYMDYPWVIRKIDTFFKPLVYKIPSGKGNFKATVILLLGYICKPLDPNIDEIDKFLVEMRQWVGAIIADDTPEIVRLSVQHVAEMLARKKKSCRMLKIQMKIEKKKRKLGILKKDKKAKASVS